MAQVQNDIDTSERKRGRPSKFGDFPPKKILLRLPPELHSELLRKAREEEISVNDLIINALRSDR